MRRPLGGPLMARRLLAPLVVLLTAPGAWAEAPDAAATRKVIAAVVEAAKKNAAATKPLKGDALTELYVRAAAAEAARLPAKQSAPAFLAALGVALDDSTLVRGNLLVGPFCRKVE